MFWKKRRSRLDAETQAKAEKLAAARGESPEDVIDRFGLKTLRKKCPRSISKRISLLRNCEFEDSGVTGDGLAWVRIKGGRTFYGFVSQNNHIQQYELTKDLLSPALKPETFLLGIDIAQRYLSPSTAWLPLEARPSRGGTVVEGGAYLGHKSVRIIDDVIGPEGRFLAVEMMPENVEILRRNIDVNELDGCMDVAPVGIWSKDEQLTVKGKGRQRNSVADLDKLMDAETEITVPVQSLDSILKDWGESRIDLLYLTINGAEVEGLRGLVEYTKKIRVIIVAAPYALQGQPTAPICRDLLSEKGFNIDDSYFEIQNYVIGVRPDFWQEYKDMQKAQRVHTVNS